jgi:hypothetical protein
MLRHQYKTNTTANEEQHKHTKGVQPAQRLCYATTGGAAPSMDGLYTRARVQ